jgi:Amt family ammonium transporter
MSRISRVLVAILLAGIGAVAAAETVYKWVDGAGQVWVQAKSVLFTAAWSGIGTLVILKLVDATIGVRVSREQEVEGLDLALHDERAYNH